MQKQIEERAKSLNDSQEMSDTPPSKNQNFIFELLSEVKRWSPLLLGLMSSYAAGYFEFRYGFVAIICAVAGIAYTNRQARKRSIEVTSRHLVADNEAQEIVRRVQDLPSWVFFPDSERAEWLNVTIKKMWPYINIYVEKFLRENTEEQVRGLMPSGLKSFRFGNVNLGKRPPRIGGIKTYSDENTKRDEVVLDMELYYAGDCDIEVIIKGVKSGIEDLQIRGNIRVILAPLSARIPLIGAVTVMFMEQPSIVYNATDLANVFDLPGLSGTIEQVIKGIIGNLLVVPNRLVVPLMQGIDVSDFKYPIPQGIVRVGIVSAKDLVDKDTVGSGKSDPYAVLQLGSKIFKTKVVDDSLNPQWNEYFEIIVVNCPGQQLELTLFDKDVGSKDDSLGNVTVSIGSIAKYGYHEQWFNLEDTKRGLVFLKTQWLSLSKDKDDTPTAQSDLSKMITSKSTGSTFYVRVLVDCANGLPKNSKKDINAYPSPYVKLISGNEEKKTKIVVDNCDPIWEEAFEFLISDPSFSKLSAEVWDSEKKNLIGKVNISVDEIINAADMYLERPYKISSGQNTNLILKCQARALIETSYIIPGEEDVSSDEESDSEAPAVAEVTSFKPSETQTSLRKPSSPHVTKLVTEVKECNMGKLHLGITFFPKRNRLFVEVKKAQKLCKADDKLPNPYIRMYLLPNKSKGSRKKTDVIKNSINPNFNFSCEFNCTEAELLHRTLDIAIKSDEGMFSSDEELGFVFIRLSSIDLQRQFDGWFPVSDSKSPVLPL